MKVKLLLDVNADDIDELASNFGMSKKDAMRIVDTLPPDEFEKDCCGHIKKGRGEHAYDVYRMFEKVSKAWVKKHFEESEPGKHFLGAVDEFTNNLEGDLVWEWQLKMVEKYILEDVFPDRDEAMSLAKQYWEYLVECPDNWVKQVMSKFDQKTRRLKPKRQLKEKK